MQKAIESPTTGKSLDEFTAELENRKGEFIVQLNQYRAQLYFKIRQVEKMGIADNYESGIGEVVNTLGKVTVADLHVVFPDGKLLTKAYKALEKAEKIVVEKAGMTWMLMTPEVAAKEKAEMDQAK